MNNLRKEVRAFVAGSGVTPYAKVDAWMRAFDPTFTEAAGRAGLIGISWPVEFGGRGATNLERLIATEELLRVGAPVAKHWISDRQIGPAILRHGTDELKREFLPRIASGDVTFCLGMSEPDSGSDLAAVRTRATRVDGGWSISGTKIWTSHAHRSTHAYVLARSATEGRKHEGLTEFLVDLSSDGVEIRPIIDLAGEHHFNETIFNHVFVPDNHVLGAVGQGWTQVTEQLSFERGGMERVLSTYPLLAHLIDNCEEADIDLAELGAIVARLHTLRALGSQIASAMDSGRAPIQQAALLKFLGTTFEGDVVELFRDSIGEIPILSGDSNGARLGAGLAAVPGATIRGGATEVLLTIVGRQALDASSRRDRSSKASELEFDELADMVSGVVGDLEVSSSADGLTKLWDTARSLGWTGIGIPESAGGEGGTLVDLAAINFGLGRGGVALPIGDTALTSRAAAAAGRAVDCDRQAAIVDAVGLQGVREGEIIMVRGAARAVPWAGRAERLLLLLEVDGEDVALLVDAADPAISVDGHQGLSGEPRDDLAFDNLTVPISSILARGSEVQRIRSDRVLLHLAATNGALDGALSSVIEHVSVREQFGKPLAAFQAVAHNVARMTADVEASRTALAQALFDRADAGTDFRLIAARVIASQASTNIARTAHQLLGAMGITHEHRLHQYTLKLWTWRDELVSQKSAARKLAMATLAAGEERFWDWCVHESDQLMTGSTSSKETA